MTPDDIALSHLDAPPTVSRRVGCAADSAIIVFGSNPWTTYLQTRQHVARGLAARGWSVTYTTGLRNPQDTMDIYSQKVALFSGRDRADGVVLDIPARWRRRISDIGPWNDLVHRRYIRHLLRISAWHRAKTRIAYVFRPDFAASVRALGDCMVVYHADDSFTKMPGITPQLVAQERWFVDRASLVVATSAGVARHLPGDGPSRARILENGADIDYFARRSAGPCPDDLRRIPRPRIGYSGTINLKVDLRLIAELATRRPAWNFVFVGETVPWAIGFCPSMAAAKSTLDKLPNVHFLGPRPYADLPRYQGHMDINALFYRTDPGGWWEDVSPLKLYEYLAVGQPVIGTNLDTLRQRRDVVAIARNVPEWLAAIENALAGRDSVTREMRRTATRGHDWTVITARLEDWILACLR